MSSEAATHRFSPPAVLPRTNEGRVIVWLFVASLCTQLLLHNGGLSGLDGETYYQVARSPSTISAWMSVKGSIRSPGSAGDSMRSRISDCRCWRRPFTS
jgi:hypothetical protein